MSKIKIKDDNGKEIEVDLDKFQKHIDEYHNIGISIHDEEGHYFTVNDNFRKKLKELNK
tara:strand:+ start:340 stop:516 length:177 start_codon:yes stop_codon:yes gene_type:complete